MDAQMPLVPEEEAPVEEEGAEEQAAPDAPDEAAMPQEAAVAEKTGPEGPGAPEAPDADPQHLGLIERGPELRAALQDNTAILMALRDRAQAAQETAFAIDADAARVQEALREAMKSETDPGKLRRLEAAYLEACKRRAQAAKSVALANMLLQSVPLTSAPEGAEADEQAAADTVADEAAGGGQGEAEMPPMRGEDTVPGPEQPAPDLAGEGGADAEGRRP